ncbi:MAG: hypothetical protein KDK08_05240 [Rhizobiaceae bacterium]|nr:hypothetical protein [Rhizobiaceae bacterium]MCC0000874.1 hypothetical protein [Methylobacteriaceae bacterium]
MAERERTMKCLRAGVEMARGAFGERARHLHVVWKLLEHAVDVIDRLPDQEKGWLIAGNRSGGWNHIGMTAGEANIIEKIRLMSAMKPGDGSSRVAPQRDDIDNAMEVLSWLRLIDDDRLRRAAVVLARKGDTEAVRRIYCPNRKPSRHVAFDVRTRAAGRIITALRHTMGIAPAPGLQFVENAK